MIDICFLSSEHPPLDKRVFQKEAKSLAAAGFSVAHIAPGPEDRRWIQDGVTLVTFARPGRGKLARLRALRRLYREAVTSDAAAYHCNEPDSWLVGCVLKLRRRRVLVFDAHEHYPSSVDRWLPTGLRAVGRAGVRLALQLMGRATDLIVLAKGSVRGDYSWSEDRHLLVLNSTSIAQLPPADREKPAGGVLRFVHSGVFGRDRGAFVLLDALDRIKAASYDAEVVLVGGFNDGSEAEFDSMAGRLGVASMIEKIDWLEYEASFDVLRSCDVGLILFTKRVENNVKAMPHKMFDYMACGLAVIAPSFAPEVRTILEAAGGALLVDTDDPAAVAEAMIKLIDEPAHATALGARGRVAVETTFSWEREAEKLADGYRRLLA